MDALLLIDIQNDYFPGGKFPLKGMGRATKNAKKILEAFRAKGLPVIHIRHVDSSGRAGFFRPDSTGSEIHKLVKPIQDETVLIKHFQNSFRDTGLLEILQRRGIKRIHVAGAQTNMCVDTTIRAGFDLGYQMILHENACAARGLLGTSLIHLISVRTLGSVFAETVRGVRVDLQ